MRYLKNILATATIAVTMAGQALAGGELGSETMPAIGVGGETSTKAFVGLNWTFGASPTPELVLGVARGKTQANGNLVGAKAAVFVDVSGGFALDKFKLSGLYGSRDLQAELGFGYNFQSSSIFGVAGANGSNYAAGVDVYGGAVFEPYIGVHSLGLFGDFGYTCVGVEDPRDYGVWTWDGVDGGSECEFEGVDYGG